MQPGHYSSLIHCISSKFGCYPGMVLLSIHLILQVAIPRPPFLNLESISTHIQSHNPTPFPASLQWGKSFAIRVKSWVPTSIHVFVRKNRPKAAISDGLWPETIELIQCDHGHIPVGEM